MKPETAQWLRDALDAAELINRKSGGQTLEGYLADDWFQSAVERQLEIIGEALNRAIRIEPEIVENLPDSRGWIGLRNVLAHAYDRIRSRIVWDTVQQEIPELMDQIQILLDGGNERQPTPHEEAST